MCVVLIQIEKLKLQNASQRQQLFYQKLKFKTSSIINWNCIHVQFSGGTGMHPKPGFRVSTLSAVEKWVFKGKAFLHFLPIFLPNFLSGASWSRCGTLKKHQILWHKWSKSRVQLALNPNFGWFHVLEISDFGYPFPPLMYIYMKYFFFISLKAGKKIESHIYREK